MTEMAERLGRHLDDEAFEALARLAAEELLQVPLAELVSPAWLAERLATTLRAASENPGTRAWLHREVQRCWPRIHESGPSAQAPLAVSPGTPLGDRIPEGVRTATERLAALPVQPDRDLVLALVDHAAMRALIQDILQDTLVRFVKRLRAMAPETAKGGAPRANGTGRGRSSLSRLRALGEGVAAVGTSMASMVGTELERQLEQRAREFASQALTAILGQLSAWLAEPRRAEILADWRVHGLRTLRGEDPAGLVHWLDPQDPEDVARILEQALDDLASDSDLQPFLEERLRALPELSPHRTLGHWAADAHLEDPTRETLAGLLHPVLRAVVGSTAFAEWLDEHLESP